jgi:hypothetical protein
MSTVIHVRRSCDKAWAKWCCMSADCQTVWHSTRGSALLHAFKRLGPIPKGFKLAVVRDNYVDAAGPCLPVPVLPGQ